MSKKRRSQPDRAQPKRAQSSQPQPSQRPANRTTRMWVLAIASLFVLVALAAFLSRLKVGGQKPAADQQEQAAAKVSADERLQLPKVELRPVLAVRAKPGAIFGYSPGLSRWPVKADEIQHIADTQVWPEDQARMLDLGFSIFHKVLGPKDAYIEHLQKCRVLPWPENALAGRPIDAGATADEKGNILLSSRSPDATPFSKGTTLLHEVTHIVRGDNRESEHWRIYFNEKYTYAAVARALQKVLAYVITLESITEDALLEDWRAYLDGHITHAEGMSNIYRTRFDVVALHGHIEWLLENTNVRERAALERLKADTQKLLERAELSISQFSVPELRAIYQTFWKLAEDNPEFKAKLALKEKVVYDQLYATRKVLATHNAQIKRYLIAMERLMQQ